MVLSARKKPQAEAEVQAAVVEDGVLLDGRAPALALVGGAVGHVLRRDDVQCDPSF